MNHDLNDDWIRLFTPNESLGEMKWVSNKRGDTNIGEAFPRSLSLVAAFCVRVPNSAENVIYNVVTRLILVLYMMFAPSNNIVSVRWLSLVRSGKYESVGECRKGWIDSSRIFLNLSGFYFRKYGSGDDVDVCCCTGAVKRRIRASTITATGRESVAGPCYDRNKESKDSLSRHIWRAFERLSEGKVAMVDTLPSWAVYKTQGSKRSAPHWVSRQLKNNQECRKLR